MHVQAASDLTQGARRPATAYDQRSPHGGRSWPGRRTPPEVFRGQSNALFNLRGEQNALETFDRIQAVAADDHSLPRERRRHGDEKREPIALGVSQLHDICSTIDSISKLLCMLATQAPKARFFEARSTLLIKEFYTPISSL